jgi:predicted nucleic acid-binding protein
LRLYLEPSVLVKLFKREPDSSKMLDIMEAIDSRTQWFACTSARSLLEVARALRKDGKPKELIELNLRELRRHKISIVDITQGILRKSESIVASRSIYASDALHAATFESVSKRRTLDGMLSDDRHFERLKGIVKVVNLNEISLDSDVS